MKTQVIPAVALLLLTLAGASCTKSHSSTSFPSCTTSANTITITDNGNTHCAGGSGLPALQLQNAQILTGQVYANYYRTDSNTFLLMAAGGASFMLQMGYINGPAIGIGSYTVFAKDSNTNTYQELFGSRQSYKCSGGSVNVTAIDSANVTATFTLNFFDATGTKVITGSLHATHVGVM